MNKEDLKHLKQIVKNDKIIIKPNELRNFKDTIYNKLKNKISLCVKDIGYITNIIEIISITSVKISRTTGNCIYLVTYKIEILKPTIGMIFLTLVNVIDKDGILTEHNNIKLFIPSTSLLTDWEYNGDYFYDSKNDLKISVGNWVKVEIIYMRYDDHNYECIGKLIEPKVN